jgi:hypothetical protein
MSHLKALIVLFAVGAVLQALLAPSVRKSFKLFTKDGA